MGVTQKMRSGLELALMTCKFKVHTVHAGVQSPVCTGAFLGSGGMAERHEGWGGEDHST